MAADHCQLAGDISDGDRAALGHFTDFGGPALFDQDGDIYCVGSSRHVLPRDAQGFSMDELVASEMNSLLRASLRRESKESGS
jgi:hypothetical protein